MLSRRPDPLLIDLDHLTAAISGEKPCGENLRYDVTYDQVREARREDDAALPQGVWATEIKRANWPTVEKLCAEALAQRSKDLQLAAWLMEAWIQLDSFAGAARGFELMRRLCLAYWDGMYPSLDGDLAARLAPIQWVNDKLPRRIRLLRLTKPGIEGMPSYSLADWDVAMRNPDGSAGSDAVTVAKFEQSVKMTGYPWFVELQRDVNATADNLSAFDNLIDAKAEKLSPGLNRFRDELCSVERLVETILASAPQRSLDAGAREATSPEGAVANGQSMLPVSTGEPAPELALDVAAVGASGARIRTRAEAYSLLQEIALFLYQNDPHSPTPYLISRAVEWGDMHFDELLGELVGDGPTMSELSKLLNIGAAAKK